MTPLSRCYAAGEICPHPGSRLWDMTGYTARLSWWGAGPAPYQVQNSAIKPTASMTPSTASVTGQYTTAK